MKGLFVSILIAISLFSCDFISRRNKPIAENDKVVARVNDSELYLSDLSKLNTKNISSEDSLSLTRRYVDNWIKKQLVLQEAINEPEVDVESIEDIVQNQRENLLKHEYEKVLWRKNSDTIVTYEEIEAFYEENQSNFELKTHIVKAILIKVHKQSEQILLLKKMMEKYGEENKEEFKDLASLESDAYNIYDSTWVYFNDLIQGTPFVNIADQVYFLKYQKSTRREEGDYVYLIQILDYKIENEVSPIEFNTKLIHNIIKNRKKRDFIKQFEDNLFKKAQNEQNFYIYQP